MVKSGARAGGSDSGIWGAKFQVQAIWDATKLGEGRASYTETENRHHAGFSVSYFRFSELGFGSVTTIFELPIFLRAKRVRAGGGTGDTLIICNVIINLYLFMNSLIVI